MTIAAIAPRGEADGRPEIDFAAHARAVAPGALALDALVEGMHCGACVARLERAFARRPEIEVARANLTARRLSLRWRGAPGLANEYAGLVRALGFAIVPFDPAGSGANRIGEDREWLRAMAVAGFGFANVMLLSVALWSGEELGPATHGLLQWFSALIALPAILFAARPFLRSAITALSHRRTNMDVPISVGVLLTSGMSLFETVRGGPHIYFDSALALLFFLLVGRYLDRRARGQARDAAARLLALSASSATMLDAAGRGAVVPIERVRPGDLVLVAPGERVPVDGRVRAGESELDTSLITGETLPCAAGPGAAVHAGMLNLGGALTIVATAIGPDTLLAEISRLMESAEQGRARYVALADRIARLYTPAVHALALATFLGWWQGAGEPWQAALVTAVTVLIVTCPCALGLAVPVVQIVAGGRLFRSGILLKSATALERLAAVDTVVFDKTGTLTLGRPFLLPCAATEEDMRLAASLAGASRHPLARALTARCPDVPVALGVREEPGRGLALAAAEGEVRLGSRAFCGVASPGGTSDEEGLGFEEGLGSEEGLGPELWLRRPGRSPVRFPFADELRPDAARTVAALAARGIAVELLSGDRPAAVARAARAAGIATWRGAVLPAGKCVHLAALADRGKHVLMVGDGLNDAPALAAAHVSLSPSSAADISQTAADAVFQGASLGAVATLIAVARRAERRVRLNFTLSIGYNALFVPLAIAGAMTPLLAAIAMSSSSLLVTLVALSLRRG
ncbi:MAG: heavy metal translocating P-type ATPase [Alphaproteobacteria bacterium]